MPKDTHATPALSPRQKAAVIVRLLLDSGAVPALSRLEVGEQAALAETMASLRRVDRDTLRAVVREFLAALEATGIVLPGGLDRALELLDGQISAQAAEAARGNGPRVADPWAEIATQPPATLAGIVAAEHPAVAAIVLSQLPTARAAEVLAALPGPLARRVALAIPETAATAPGTVARIGATLAGERAATPPRAFSDDPATRIGAILTLAPGATREALLDEIERDDSTLAEAVRRRILTFADLPDRLEPREVPRALRTVEPAVLVTALLHGRVNAPATADFLLQNMSKRLAEQTRAEMAEQPPVAPRAGEAAQIELVTAIRMLSEAGEISLVSPDEDGADA